MALSLAVEVNRGQIGGVAYNETGFTRPGANLTWTAQSSTDWLGQFANGTNIKHADCDGNGLIDANDTTAVSLNYGLTHFKTSELNVVAGTTPLYFDIPMGNISGGQNISIPIILGTGSIPANNVYGIAFTINYNPAMIQDADINVSYNNSWLVPSSNNVHLEKNFSSSGKLDMGFCRINHADTSGNGNIATLNFTTDINASGPLTLSFSDITLISSDETVVPVNPDTSTLVITGMEEIGIENNIALYPNPASELVYINFSSISNAELVVNNIVGNVVFHEQANLQQSMVKMDVSGFPEGVYFLKIITGAKITMKKFSVIR